MIRTLALCLLASAPAWAVPIWENKKNPKADIVPAMEACQKFANDATPNDYHSNAEVMVDMTAAMTECMVKKGWTVGRYRAVVPPSPGKPGA